MGTAPANTMISHNRLIVKWVIYIFSQNKNFSLSINQARNAHTARATPPICK